VTGVVVRVVVVIVVIVVLLVLIGPSIVDGTRYRTILKYEDILVAMLKLLLSESKKFKKYLKYLFETKYGLIVDLHFWILISNSTSVPKVSNTVEPAKCDHFGLPLTE